MNLVRNLISSLLLMVASFAATTGQPHIDEAQITIPLDKIGMLPASINKETVRLTNVEERLKSEIKRSRDGMDSAVGKIMQEFQRVQTELTNVEERLSDRIDSAIGRNQLEFESVRTEVGNVGQKLEETLLMGIEKAGNTTIETLRRDQLLREHPKNCEEIQYLGHKSSGVYRVYPFDLKEHPNGKELYCDLLTAGGGWTVIQRRKESLTVQEDFYRTWDEYASGFGNLNDSHWIGLDVIAALTRDGDNKLRIELTDWEGENRVATYSNFLIANLSDNYRLNVSGYYGDAGDSLTYHNGMAFSTKDRDNDVSTGSCAQGYHGAWWYNNCHWSGLNGMYYGENNKTVISTGHGINWHHWLGNKYSLKRSEMKFRSNHFQP